MKIHISGNQKNIHIKISGSINQTGAEELKAHLNTLNLEQTQEVVIDFANVTYIGSAGVGKFLLLYKNMVIDDSRIRMINVSPEIYSLFMDMKLDEIFSIQKGL